MGTKERVEILNKSNCVTNELLKRISNLEFEVERLNNENEELLSLYRTEGEVKDKYKERIDKAIEYIEKHRIGNEYSYEYNLFTRNARTSDLLNILKGSDKE